MVKRWSQMSEYAHESCIICNKLALDISPRNKENILLVGSDGANITNQMFEVTFQEKKT